MIEVRGCGAVGEVVKPADDRVASLLAAVKAEFGERAGVKVGDIFKAVNYKTQIVAGVNYFAKVELGGGKYAHLRIHEPLAHLQQAPHLAAFQLDKRLEDPIEHF